MNDDEAQYWAQMQAEAAAHEAEQAAADAAEHEAAMEAEQAKKTMPPFRAWVAWHPENELREKLSVYREKDECTRFIGYLRNNDIVPSHKSGWRIVEVEVREVGSV